MEQRWLRNVRTDLVVPWTEALSRRADLVSSDPPTLSAAAPKPQQIAHRDSVDPSNLRSLEDAKAIARLQAENAQLRADIARLTAHPAGAPAPVDDEAPPVAPLPISVMDVEQDVTSLGKQDLLILAAALQMNIDGRLGVEKLREAINARQNELKG